MAPIWQIKEADPDHTSSTGSPTEPWPRETPTNSPNHHLNPAYQPWRLYKNNGPFNRYAEGIPGLQLDVSTTYTGPGNNSGKDLSQSLRMNIIQLHKFESFIFPRHQQRRKCLLDYHRYLLPPHCTGRNLRLALVSTVPEITKDPLDNIEHPFLDKTASWWV